MAKHTNKEKQHRPWDRRPWPKSGDLNIEKTYAAVGAALSEWERYEGALSHLFGFFVTAGGPATLAARRSYSAVRTFEGRTDMLRAASGVFFYNDPNTGLQEEFKSILAHAKEFGPRRNDIAHGVVDQYQPQPPAPRIVPSPNEYGLFPSYSSFKERDTENIPTYCCTSDELDYFRQEFFKLKDEAWKLSGRISLYAASSRSKPVLRHHKSTSPEADRKD